MLRWLEALKANMEARGWSPRTVVAVLRDLKSFHRWLGKDDPTGVTLRTLKEYLHHLTSEYRTKAGTPLAYGTVTHRIQSVRIYFGFLAKQRLILFDPASALPERSKVRRLPDYIASEQEVQRLLTLPCPEEHNGIRDRAILEFLYSTGMRRRELALLELGDVDLNEQLVKIQNGKGDKERVVPFGRAAKGALERYLTITRPRWQRGSDLESPRLFLSEWGRSLNIDMMTEIVAKYRPDKRIHPHGLRHACALHMLKAGADIRYIQELLGHVSPRTTLIYTRFFPADLLAFHDRYHPREKIRDCAET